MTRAKSRHTPAPSRSVSIAVVNVPDAGVHDRPAHAVHAYFMVFTHWRRPMNNSRMPSGEARVAHALRHCVTLAYRPDPRPIVAPQFRSTNAESLRTAQWTAAARRRCAALHASKRHADRQFSRLRQINAPARRCRDNCGAMELLYGLPTLAALAYAFRAVHRVATLNRRRALLLRRAVSGRRPIRFKDPRPSRRSEMRAYAHPTTVMNEIRTKTTSPWMEAPVEPVRKERSAPPGA